MVFTKEDAKDDAKIKSEVRGDLLRVAKNQSPKVFQHFEQVCQQLDQDPGDVLADMLVKSINNQQYADEIIEQEVTMDVIQSGEYRKDDIEMVKSLADEFDLTPDEKEDSIVDRIIESRIEAASTTPLEQIGESAVSDGDSKEKEIELLEKQVEQLSNELERVKSNETSQSQQTGETVTTTETQESESKKELDELFDGSDGEEQETETEPSDESDEGDDSSADISVDVSSSNEDDEKGEMEGEVEIGDVKSASDAEDEGDVDG